MFDTNVLAVPGSQLYKFLTDSSFSGEYARKSLPVLVRWVEDENASHGQGIIPERTYQKLATTLGDASKTHPIHFALGLLGDALRELQKQHPKQFGKQIPPIQMIVWTKGAGRPGDDAFGFIGVKKKQVQSLPEDALRTLALKVRQDILAYPHWRLVLKYLKLEPLIIDLPDPASVINDPDFGGHRGGESPEHKRMKHYVKRNYRRLGLIGEHLAELETPLLSGDKLDVSLEHFALRRFIGVEVKSRISSDADIIRGVFQCVKYRAVLNATEDHLTAQDKAWTSRTIEVLLVTERALPKAIAALAELLRVRHLVVVVPESFSVSGPAEA